MDSWFFGFLGTVAALVLAVVSFDIGRGSVAGDCRDYGKARINRDVYVCAKQ